MIVDSRTMMKFFAQIVSGLLGEENDGHFAEQLVKLSAALLEVVKASDTNDRERIAVELRTGIHSGNVVAGVVGSIKQKFCLFGETVQVTCKLEASSKASFLLHCSVDTKRLVESSSGEFKFTDIGQMKHNNLELLTFYLSGSMIEA